MLYRLSVVNKRDISTLQHNVHKVNSRHINRKSSISWRRNKPTDFFTMSILDLEVMNLSCISLRLINI